LTDRQIAVVYDHLTRTDHDVMGGMLGLATYGGRINTVAPDATASAQRGSILDMACTTGWQDPREEAGNLAWVRGFYRDLFAESGGVPVPGEACEGCFINHPDPDLADPGPEYLRRALAHPVLPGELPAPAAGQGTMGPAERVPPRALHSSALTTSRRRARDGGGVPRIDLRAHSLLADVPLHDVWAVDLSGRRPVARSSSCGLSSPPRTCGPPMGR
jgi:hypothetical protein